MTTISVIEMNGLLVVDSRLVAKELGLQHKNLLGNIRSHQTAIEHFGAIAFETREAKTVQGNKFQETIAFLNEEQAIFVMTLSRNTPRVIQCKINLVKAFSDAKKIIADKTIPNCQALTVENANLKAEVDRLKSELASQCHEPKVSISHSQRRAISEVWEQTENLHGVLTIVSGAMQVGLSERRYGTDLQEVEALLGTVKTAISVTKSICHSLDAIDRNLLVQQIKAITA